MKKNDKLSVRERKLIKNILAGVPVTNALKQAGYAETTALKRQKQIVGKHRIMTAMQQAYEAAGISDKRLSEVAKEGLEATKTISAMIVAPNGEGMKDAHSMTKDFIEVPDYATRHKYLDTAHKLRGDYPSEKHEVEHTGNVNLVFEVIKN